MSQKIIILAIVLMFGASFTSLAYTEKRAADPDLGKDWWAVSFDSPYDNTMGFTIENHGHTNYFSYVVTKGDKAIDRNFIIVPEGKSVTVPLEGMQSLRSKKTVVSVWTSLDDRKELSK